MPTKTHTADAIIGDGYLRVHTEDAVIQKSSTKTHTEDAYLSKYRYHTADAIIADSRGSFRGIGLMSERDALAPKYAGDTYVTVDDENNRHHHYWTGTFWIETKTHQASEMGTSRNYVAPTTAGWRFEIGDQDYPFQHWDGSQRNMYGKSDGTLYGNSLEFGTGSTLAPEDYIDLPEVTGASASTPALRQSASNTASATSITVTWSIATAASSFITFAVGIDNTSAVSTPPTGFTLLETSTNTYGDLQTLIYGKANSSAGEANPSITFASTGKMWASVTEWTNIITTSLAAAHDDPADANDHGSDLKPGVSTPGSTTAQAQEVWLVAAYVRQANTYSAPTNGFTIATQDTRSGASGYLSYRIVTSQGTPTSTASKSSTSSIGYAAVGVAIKTAGTTSDSGTPDANHGRFYVADRSGVSAPYFKDDAGIGRELSTPPGVIEMYGGTSAPTGYVMCDGSSLLRSGTYAALFAVISTTYGSADGTHFNVPDLRQSFPLGKAASGTGSTLGSTGGNIDHTHTGPSHTHDVAGTTTGPSSAPSNMTAGGATSYAGAAHNHDFSDTSTSDGTGATGSKNPPYVVVNFIIAY